MTIRKQLEKDLATAFKKLKFETTLAQVSSSSVASVDYQCNASFQLAKSVGKNPFDVANEIAGVFKSGIATCGVSRPAFLNFSIKISALEKMGDFVLSHGKIPLAQQKKQMVFFDYGAPNIGKEMHIGHLRSPIIGEALKRVFESFGHATKADNYLGDWGLPLGLIIGELEIQGVIKNNELVGEITLELLNEIYPKASKRKDDDKDFLNKARSITAQMQSGEEPYYSLWKQIRQLSVEKISKIYDEMFNCTFDFYNGESFAQPYVDVVIDILKKKGLTYEDKGCLLIDVKEENENRPMPPFMLQKAGGGDLYATSDIATIYWRYKEFKPDQFIYVVDDRQSLHFTQLFRIAKKGGMVSDNTKLVHVGLGTINGKDGKPFRTRAGGTVRLEDVIEMVSERVKGRVEESGRSLDKEVIKKIALSALKFADLAGNVRSGYVFDIDKFTDFNGKTGPYLLYTVARINSVLSKVDGGQIGNSKLVVGDDINEDIRKILASVMKISDAYIGAMQSYSLNGIVESVYNLAQEFNTFYANTNILKEKDAGKKALYLNICTLVKKSLEFALNTLAIDVVESM